jgi:hypothetical protein
MRVMNINGPNVSKKPWTHGSATGDEVLTVHRTKSVNHDKQHTTQSRSARRNQIYRSPYLRCRRAPAETFEKPRS